jgi:hypothetical protein
MKDEMKIDRANACRASLFYSWFSELIGSFALLKNRYPRGFSVYPAASQPAVPALARSVHLADSRSARFSLGRMKVLVFGNSGSGKSTYARDLAAREGGKMKYGSLFSLDAEQ